MSKSLNYRNVFWSKAPESWEQIKIGDIVKRINKRYKNSDIENIEVLSITNDRGFIDPEDKFDKKVASDDVDNYKIVKKNQFAYNPARINVGSIAFLEDFDKGLISPMYEVFEANKDLVDLNFIKYFFKSYKAISLYDAYSQGSVRQTLKFDLMKEIPYVLPTLPEQKKIASILSSVDKAIEKTDEVIEKTKELKKGLMQQLLTKGIGHSEFKEVRVGTKLINIPTKWELLQFDKVYKKRSKRNTDDESYNYIGLEHIESGNVNLIGFDKNGQERSSSRMFKKGDILYGKLRPYLDKAAVSSFEGICSTDIIPIYSSDLSTNEYLLYLLHSKFFIDFAVSTMEGTNLPRTSWRVIKNLNIPVPPLEEQKKIASILSSVDAKIKKEEEYKEKLERLKKGLMQKLLTGEVRVNTYAEV